jgi:superkiller protein 3
MAPETVEHILALLKERPEDAELYQQLGGAYFNRGDLQEAWKAYMQSLRLNPDDPFTCLFFGTLLTLCDDKKYAMDLFEHASSLAPELAVVHWCRANLHRSQGEFELAEQAYRQAVAVEPENEEARQKLADWRKFIAETRGS